MSVQSTMSSAIGGVQKAFLIIHKADAEDVNSGKVSEKTQSVLLNASAESRAGALGLKLKAAGLNVHVMQVQYNPSSLSIQANAASIPFILLQQNVDSGVPNQSARPPTVMLSVELIFDAMNPADAFMMDKMRLSPGSAVSDMSGIVQNVKNGGYTVQPQTEGLVAALMRPGTRMVTFRWADMVFTGQLSEVQAEYTMFSVSGKPIRSKVRMNIAQQVESEADVSYWDRAMDKVFGKNELADLKDVGQRIGNLINLDMF